MPFALPPLPYAPEALEPHLSRETLETHHGKHHRKYVETANALLAQEPELATLSPEELVLRAEGALFNNAAQAWNHGFLWQCLTPEEPPLGEELQQALARHFGDADRFEKKFAEAAAGVFGSGWAWLVKNSAGELEILTTKDGDNPLTHGLQPLLTCDVWEHAYYLDYRNDRAQYLQHFFRIVNWEFVGANLLAAPPRLPRRTRRPESRPKFH